MATGCVAVSDYTPDSHFIRAASPLAKPLPMEQFQVIQGFICKVPQGKKMVEEVSKGAQDIKGRDGAVASVTGVCVCLCVCVVFLSLYASSLLKVPFSVSPIPRPLVVVLGGSSDQCLCRVA